MTLNTSASGTEPFKWNCEIRRANGTWIGKAVKENNPTIVYDLSGTELGGRLAVHYSSAKKLEGLGAYLLVHRDSDGAGGDMYAGYWVGRDCSIRSHPYVQCAMAVTHLSMDLLAKYNPV
jgi:hypothetical protein